MNFSHLHCHTQFSLLDGAADISKLYKKAIKDKMPAIAITDHGNMLGVFQFVAEASKYNTKENPCLVKPIVGCEFYLVEDRTRQQFTKDQRDKRYHQLLLAKNEIGYRNLVKLCSLGYTEGLYGKYPRIDKQLILQYKEGLIATTCCIGAEVPQAILHKSEEEAEKTFRWWLELFGDDYFIEVQRHGMKDQEKVNSVLLKFSEKFGVPVIASNDSHYVDKQDANAHDILLCLNTGDKLSSPKYTEFTEDDFAAKGKRFAFFNDEFYFKTTAEMQRLFHDIPQAIENTQLIVDKVEMFDLKKNILLPNYQIPAGFLTQMEYLTHLTYDGAKKRYGDLLDESIVQRIQDELNTIDTMGFAGYFLIVADFIKAGRDLGVLIGPGRGSAAGSVVAYSVGITNIDPIKYNLLFERFLNPSRKEMPDIDTDFDDEGRQKVIDYVIEKYGKNQVAQIVTYGTMAARSSIKDVARVMELPLDDAKLIVSYVPERPSITLQQVIEAPLTGNNSLTESENLNADEVEGVQKIREIAKGNDKKADVIREALILEGSVRNTGVHAAGVIIAPKDLTEIIPVQINKDTGMLVTQFEGKVIENAGVIKMDFLGLKNLSIIKEALKLIKQNFDVDIDLDNLPLDDEKTYQLYQRAETNATFQFESVGMQKYLRELKPDKFDDLIAMNALYRPGPLSYIPTFIKRKQGLEPIEYDLPELEEYLAETYGITVYQEQVMLLSQKLGNFSKADADNLRKAMGKKQRSVLDKMKEKFMDGCRANGLNLEKCEKVWGDWEAFASYAFNKSHSTCYALVAYQTAYLKANYPIEYMAAVLTCNAGQIEKVSFFMQECKRMGIPVKSPDVNESDVFFTVNTKGEIRFALSAVKGVGEAAMESMIAERSKNGPFKSIYDFVERVNLRNVNKKNMEALVESGAFDSFGLERAQYLVLDEGSNVNFIEKLIRYGNQLKEHQKGGGASLFGDSNEIEIQKPQPPKANDYWGNIETLRREKEVVGIYLSGHPLDNYKIQLTYFCTPDLTLKKLNEALEKYENKDLLIGGVITKAEQKTTKNGKPYGRFILEDYEDKREFILFGEDYLRNREYLLEGLFVRVKGTVAKRSYEDKEGKRPLEFKIQSIQLLESILENQTKSVVVKVMLNYIDTIFINSLSDVLAAHKGKTTFKLWITNGQDMSRVETFSRNHRVQLSEQLFTDLQNIGDVIVTLA